ncbi:MAG TPA: DUF2085 domain-containing protein [Chloroflexota bacterium]|nr:DUF2085 domain-containing protein [Chloroflexota bacterium]
MQRLPAIWFGVARHWLLGVNVAAGLFVGGAVLAPLLSLAGFERAADALYALYHAACHQWAFRSFFLFGAQAVYGRDELLALGVDPFSFVGEAESGWKIAVCERDLAIYASVFGFGLLYARSRDLRPLSFPLYACFVAPMALDGFTQLFGWRESTWELRLLTGMLFGLASGWLVYPRLDAWLRAAPSYPPEPVCAAAPPSLTG